MPLLQTKLNNLLSRLCEVLEAVFLAGEWTVWKCRPRRRQEQLETIEVYDFQGTKENVEAKASFLYSIHLSPRIYNQSQQPMELFNRWDKLIKAAPKVCSKRQPTVAVYSYGSL